MCMYIPVAHGDYSATHVHSFHAYMCVFHQKTTRIKTIIVVGMG